MLGLAYSAWGVDYHVFVSWAKKRAALCKRCAAQKELVEQLYTIRV